MSHHTATINLEATDVAGQIAVSAPDVPVDATVGEVIRGLLGEMHLPENNSAGNPLTYQARLEREGRHLHASERVGDALQENDRIVLQPEIEAG
jgi:hypothetical protein